MSCHTIRDLLGLRAQTSGPDDAILAPGREPLSFADLLIQVERIGSHLRGAGVGPTDRAALVLPNGPDLAAAFVGVAAAAACAPLNPGFTESQFEFYLRDLGAKVLLIPHGDRGPARQAAGALGVPIIEVQPGRRAGEFDLSSDAGAIADWPRPDDTALLLHTSGTTSRPKLVPLSGRNLTASAAHITAALALDRSDRCLNIMPLFHVHGLMAAVLASLHAGASVVCTNGVYATSFFEWTREYHPTWYTAVPTMHQGVLAQARSSPAAAASVSFRFIRSSSAPLPVSVLEELERTFRAPVIEAYGMTEASHQMASNPLPPSIRKPGSVGRAAGPEIAVMDADGVLLPAGSTGEVVIRGPNVMTAYEGAPSLSAAAFSGGWFRTGDQGRLDRDGYLFLTGRLKEIINRGGEKIAPREIDELLLTHPAVRQAVCFAVPHVQLGEEIGAAVEVQPGSTLTASELRTWAAARLPSFKVPRVIRFVDRIPTGATGKLQRAGLAEALGIETLDDARRSARPVPPRTAVEARIARLWSQMLPGVDIGIHDRFEALGGDSLLAAVMLSAVSASEGVALAAARFLEEGTIEALAADVAASPRENGEPIVALRAEGLGRPLYCVPGHEGGLFALTLLAHAIGHAPLWAVNLNRLRPAGSIEEVAEIAVAALRRHTPGPYQLAGSCFGGLVAFEMARQLKASGATVEMLALIDTLYPAWRATSTRSQVVTAWLRQARLKAAGHSRALRELSAAAAARYLTTRMRAFVKNHGQTVAAQLKIAHDRAVLNRGLAIRYRGGAYEGSALVIRVPGRRPEIPALGWRSLVTGGVEVITLPDSFAGALSRHNLPVVADALRERLAAQIDTTVPARAEW